MPTTTTATTMTSRSMMVGKILILRFDSTLYGHEHYGNTFTTSAAICNAMQEPGIVNNFNMPLLGGTYRECQDETMLSPEERTNGQMNLLNMLTVAVRMGRLHGNPMSDLPLLTRSSMPRPDDETSSSAESIVTYLSGIESEASEFCKTMPPFFFINCGLIWLDRDACLRRKSLYVPVFFKSGHYYICNGENKSKVYRVHDPRAVFFSESGHRVLEIVLSWVYQNDYQHHKSSDGLQLHYNPRVMLDLGGHQRPSSGNLFCIPKKFHHGPSNWDKLG